MAELGGLNMALVKEHELHKRRGRRNLFVGLILGSFVTMVFAITMVKLGNGQMLQAFDHSVRPELIDAGK
jgi:hypothetical protein